MASGQTLAIFTPQANEPPTTNGAYFNARNTHLLLAFGDSVATSAVFPGVLPRNYSGGGITARVCWLGAVAITGSVKWNLQFERHQAASDDLDADAFAAAQTATATVPATSGMVQYTDIAFTDGAQVDSVAAGESFRLKLTRDAADAADTMTGLAQLTRVELRET